MVHNEAVWESACRKFNLNYAVHILYTVKPNDGLCAAYAVVPDWGCSNLTEAWTDGRRMV